MNIFCFKIIYYCIIPLSSSFTYKAQSRLYLDTQYISYLVSKYSCANVYMQEYYQQLEIIPINKLFSFVKPV